MTVPTPCCRRHYLAVPDLLAYWLTGVMKNERTHASTTQLYNPVRGLGMAGHR